MSENGVTPAGTADKQLGEIVGDVTAKAQLLVREEIALAKAEIAEKVSRIVKGVIAFSMAGFFVLMMIVIGLNALSWGFHDWFDFKFSVSFGITTAILLLLAVVAALVGLRFFKRGAPPTPDLAIEEAQKTIAALEETRA